MLDSQNKLTGGHLLGQGERVEMEDGLQVVRQQGQDEDVSGNTA